MSLLSHILETYYIDADEEEAVVELCEHLRSAEEQKHSLKQQWQSVLLRGDAAECTELVNDYAHRGPGDANACRKWLQEQYDAVFAKSL